MYNPTNIIKFSGGILLCGVFVVLSFYQVFGAPSNTSDSDVAVINVTHSVDRTEVNPQFSSAGNSIFFLLFTGDPLSPQPWDHVLAKTDLENDATHILSESGIVDYILLPDGKEILLLTAPPNDEVAEIFCTYDQEIENWQLLKMNLLTGETKQVSQANGRSIWEGYRALGRNIPSFDSGSQRYTSPDKSREIVLAREDQGDTRYFNFYQNGQRGEQKLIFSTESVKLYQHFDWFPSIIWLNENSFLTLSHRPGLNPAYPHSQGLFSITKIDCKNNEYEILYQGFDLSPFPKIVYNPLQNDFYFHKKPLTDRTEIWSYDLDTRETKLLYSVEGELGKARVSPDGSLLVFTQLSQNNGDIILLSMPSRHLLAGK